MIMYDHVDKCVYCLIDYIQRELGKTLIERDDYYFSLQALEHRYAEVDAAYQAAIKDNQDKYIELMSMKNKLKTYEK